MNITTHRIARGQYATQTITTLDGKPAGVAFAITRDDLHRNWVVTAQALRRGEPIGEIYSSQGGLVLACQNSKKDCVAAIRSIAVRGFRTSPDGCFRQNFLKVFSNARLALEQQAALEVFKKLEEAKSST